MFIRRNVTNFNLHLLKCRQKALTDTSERLAWEHFLRNTRICQWDICGYDLKPDDPARFEAAKAHMKCHFKASRRGVICKWASCEVQAKTKAGLLQHLNDAHGVPLSTGNMAMAQFCHECSEFFIDENVWEDHCNTHLQDIDTFCGQVVNKGVILFHRKCIFCLGDGVLSAARRYQGYTIPTTFFEHLENHIHRVTEWPLECPHPRCSQESPTQADFWQHLQDVHGITRYGPKSTKVPNADATVEPGSVISMHESCAESALQEPSQFCGQDSNASPESSLEIDLPEPSGDHEGMVLARPMAEVGQQPPIGPDCMMHDLGSSNMSTTEPLDSPAVSPLECNRIPMSQHTDVKTTKEDEMDCTPDFGPLTESILRYAALDLPASPLGVTHDGDVEEEIPACPSSDPTPGLEDSGECSLSELKEGMQCSVNDKVQLESR
jgi:hypothetical protein